MGNAVAFHDRVEYRPMMSSLMGLRDTNDQSLFGLDFEHGLEGLLILQLKHTMPTAHECRVSIGPDGGHGGDGPQYEGDQEDGLVWRLVMDRL